MLVEIHRFLPGKPLETTEICKTVEFELRILKWKTTEICKNSKICGILLKSMSFHANFTDFADILWFCV